MPATLPELTDKEVSLVRLSLLNRRDWLLTMYDLDPDPIWQGQYWELMAVYYKFNPQAIGRIL